MDCIIVNAAVRTMADAPHPARATAVAVRGNRISRVGESGEIRALAGKNTRVIDARRQLLLPGFNDAHVHFLDGGFSLSNVSLRDAGSTAEFIRRIAGHARKTPPGKWIIGGEWDHERWPGAPLPTRQMIDAVTPDNPVFLSRLDGHMALANGLALKLAGVTRQIQDVPGGSVVRDPATGEPTGLLKDAAMDYVRRVVPRPGAAEKKEAARRATDYAAQLGVTSVQDVLAGDDVEIYRALAESGELKTRVYGLHPIARWEELAAKKERPQSATGMVRTGGVKGFADGSLGSATAFFFEPYLDDPKNCGLAGEQMFPEGAMLRRVLGADRAGLQVALHAIGDRANFEVLNLFQTAAEQNGPRDRRFRIEHAQHLRRADIPRFGRQRVIASVQPYHAIDDGRWCQRRLGPERLRGTYAFRSLLDADWVVAPLDPMLTLFAAVTRRTLDGQHPGGWLPEQKVTVGEAVRAYTAGSAWAEFAEGWKGRIVPGQAADLVLLDRNIFEIAPEEIPTVRVALTMVDGRVVWERR
jgi:predicted amidohydrolase YtcJ